MQICGICGSDHCAMDCDIIQMMSHIPDKVIPSKAKLTLPEDLILRKMADNTYSVVTTHTIDKGTQFGPLQAKKLCSLLPAICFPLRVFYETEDDLSEYYLDTSDENECNWMIFINPASDFQEQNIVCYQDGEDIYYITSRDIGEGEPLKVWYSPYYATKMKKDILKPLISETNENLKNNECIDALVRKKKNITSREMWSCKFCGKMERNLSEFALHLLKHYRAKLGRHCQICNVSFKQVQVYQKHMKIVHQRYVINNKPSIQSEAKPVIKKEDKQTDSLSKENYFGDPLLLNEFLGDSMDNTNLALHPLDLTGIENHSNLFENENLNLNMESILPESDKHLDNFNFELDENDTEQFVCDICLKIFRKLMNMIKHMNVHTGKFTCFDCNKVFARKENLNYHPCNLFYKFQCPHCTKIFFQKKYFFRHLQKCRDKKDKLQERTASKKPLTAHPTVTYPCNQCSKRFTHKNNLIIHSSSHLPREKYTCPVCNKLLCSEKTYKQHYKLHEGHLNKCEICEKVFKRKDTLNYHINHVHSAIMENCPICNKAVKSKKLLKVHMKLHKENSFKCSQCPSTFKQQHNLARHIKMNHEMKQSFLSNIDKEYSCPKCDKKFTSSKTRNRHLETIHPEEKNDYKISHEMNQSFLSNIDKQYSCPKCDKKFKLNRSLKKHLETLHPEKKIDYKISPEMNQSFLLNIDKQYSCPKCDKKFKLSRSLKKHLETLHPEEKIDNKTLNLKKNNPRIEPNFSKQMDDSVMDLKQTIENMNYTTDEITIEIDKLLNNPQNFGSESNDRLVESLINTAVGETNLENKMQPEDPMLSMPDLDI